MPQKVCIIGAGLIGSSIGLALRAAGIAVEMLDSDPKAQALAQDLMASIPDNKEADLVIFALPISAISSVIDEAYQSNLNATFMDISSIKNKVKVEVSTSVIPKGYFLPSHPMAGREVGGAHSARGDLFAGRIWAYDPDGVSKRAVAHGLAVIQACGATPVAIESEDHDRAVAQISHLPQIISSLLASQLNEVSGQALELAGGGLRDTTRIAASSSALWSEIITANSEELRPLLKRAISDLSHLLDHIEEPKIVAEFIEAGNRGHSRIPGKHGGVARNYSQLPVVIEDKPGQLARLFDECADAQVNVEDLSIEHSPEQFTGLITLSLSEGDAQILYSHLQSRGWKVHLPRQ